MELLFLFRKKLPSVGAKREDRKVNAGRSDDGNFKGIELEIAGPTPTSCWHKRHFQAWNQLGLFPPEYGIMHLVIR